MDEHNLLPLGEGGTFKEVASLGWDVAVSVGSTVTVSMGLVVAVLAGATTSVLRPVAVSGRAVYI